MPGRQVARHIRRPPSAPAAAHAVHSLAALRARRSRASAITLHQAIDERGADERLIAQRDDDGPRAGRGRGQGGHAGADRRAHAVGPRGIDRDMDVEAREFALTAFDLGAKDDDDGPA